MMQQDIFERKLSLLRECHDALRQPLIRTNPADVKFVESLKNKAIAELQALIIENPELKRHPLAMMALKPIIGT